MRRRWVVGLCILAAIGVSLALWGSLGAGDPAPPPGPRRTGEPPAPSPRAAPPAESSAAALATAPPTRALTGSVVDGRTGEGVPGAAVIFFADAVHVRATADDGTFGADSVPDGTWNVFVWHPSYVSPGLAELLGAEDDGTRDRSRVALPPPDGAPLTLRVFPGSRVEGRVVDAQGRPVPRAGIRVEDGDWRRLLEMRMGTSLRGWETHVPLAADEEGRFAISCLPDALAGMRLAAHVPRRFGRWSEPLALERDAPTVVTLEVVEGAAVEGRVLDASGTPVAGAEVWLATAYALGRQWLFDAPEYAPTDAAGSYRLAPLPPSTVGLSASWVDPRMTGAEHEVHDLAPGEVRSAIDFVLAPRHVFSGRLRDASGSGLARQRLGLVPSNARDAEETTTDDDGTFVEALRVPGPFDVVHRMPDRDDVTLLRGVLLPARDLDLTSVPMTRTTVRLRVVDPEGKPVPRFRSAVTPLGREGWTRFTDQEDGADGLAVHDVAGRAPFRVMITTAEDGEGDRLPWADSRTEVSEVPADGTVEVRLRRDDVVEGRFVDEAGLPVPGVRMTLEIDVPGTDENESRAVEVAADGGYRVSVDPRSTPPVARVSIPEGYLAVPCFPLDPAVVRTTVLRPGGVLAGRVVASPPRPAGPPVPRIAVEWTDRAEQRERDLEVDVRDDGTWRAVGVPLGVDLEVLVRPHVAMEHGYRPPPPIERRRAGETDVEIHLAVGLRIAGRCVDAAGRPTGAGFHLVAWALDPESASRVASTQVTADGAFSLEGLDAGRYRLRLHGTGLWTLAEREAQAGEEALTMRVPEQGEIRLTVVGGEASWGG